MSRLTTEGTETLRTLAKERPRDAKGRLLPAPKIATEDGVIVLTATEQAEIKAWVEEARRDPQFDRDFSAAVPHNWTVTLIPKRVLRPVVWGIYTVLALLGIACALAGLHFAGLI